MKNINKNIWLIVSWVVGGSVILILFPILTNLLMFVSAPDFIAPFGVEQNNVWIGYFASFFGATIGGAISGLFTFLGVNKTLRSQEEKDAKEYKIKYRTILEIHEIYKGELFLKNLNQKNGRLIITDEYKSAITLDLSDGRFNYIELSNSGGEKAFNCKARIEVKYLNSNFSTHVTEVRIPIIFHEENIYIPIDKIKGENNKILASEEYVINHISIEYETFANETIKIDREINENKLTRDKYSFKSSNEEEFKPLHEIKGSENEWYFLKDNNS